MDRPGAGALPAILRSVAFDEPLLALADRELPRLRAVGRTLTIALPQHEAAAQLTVSTDSDQLTTILLNLLDNARKYGARGRCGWRTQASPSTWPTRWPCRWSPPLAPPHRRLIPGQPNGPGTGLDLGIAGCPA